jgi:hypothetical protein
MNLECFIFLLVFKLFPIFLAWTSSKVLFGLKIMKMTVKNIVKNIIFKICKIAIMREILVNNLYLKLVDFSLY